MKTIWKYSMDQPDCTFDMPWNAKVLCVQVQNEIPQLWVLIDPSEYKIPTRFKTYGTGHDIPDNAGIYIGTFQMFRGRLVFHVFQETL